MSHQVEANTTQPNNMSVALGVLGMFFLFLFAFLATSQSTISTPGEGNREVAIVPTDLPSSTPVPPTATFTSQPTATPIPPTATLTLQPSPTVIPPTAVSEPTVEVVADTGTTTAYDPALIAEGQELFLACSACHGPDAHGLPNLGKDLVNSEFVHSLSDADLLTFIKTGRPIWDAMNTTGIDMPPRGGNPALTDDDLLAIIAYVRSMSAQGG
jgi:disulfide bond formation protein DsbB